MLAQRRRHATRRDWVLAALAVSGIALGSAVGLPTAALALLTMALPVAGFLVAGHVSGRGAVAGCVALAVGVTLIRPSAGVVPWGDVALLGLISLTAMVAGTAADRLAPRAPVPSPADGRWLTIVVECDGPAGLSGTMARPKVSPRNDPERRSLTRRAHDRRPRPAALAAVAPSSNA
ncbi:MAG TPA: hypothetical protein VG406_12420 [Isosphaeraceae bacterium]|jgi:hypothetical protein|nr:hypothetical protein [Isosphaeraceae bacterium]